MPFFVEHVFENTTSVAGIALALVSAPTVVPALIKHRHRVKKHWPWLMFAAVFFAMSFIVRWVT
jgi:hypothetical protein